MFTTRSATMLMQQQSPLERKLSKSEVLHSGQFMVSEIDDTDLAADPVAETSEVYCETQNEVVRIEEEKDMRYDLEVECTKPNVQNLVMIDGSLSKLFECMTLAYEAGKITSPKWKTFKGLKVKVKDKIRLNNMIWRAWHMQYILGHKAQFCQFASPIDYDAHIKPEAVVLEGKYWKRRATTVAAEYRKWRLFYKSRYRFYPHLVYDGNMRWTDWKDWELNTDYLSINGVEDDFMMDFNDTSLFNSLLSPNIVEFPNQREIARLGIGDLIQPGLSQLQPNIDDFNESLEPFQDLFMSAKFQQNLPPLPEETATAFTHNISNQQKIIQPTGARVGLIDESLTPDSTSFEKSYNIDTQSSMEVTQFENELSKQYSVLYPSREKMPCPNQPTSGAISLISSDHIQVPQTQTASLAQFTATQSSQMPRSFDAFDKVLTSAKTPQLRDSTMSNFAVPKNPVRQRSRSRSASSLQNTRQLVAPAQTPPPMFVSDANFPKTSHIVERSISLPVYANRRNNLIASGGALDTQLVEKLQRMQNQNQNTSEMHFEIQNPRKFSSPSICMQSDSSCLIAQLLTSNSKSHSSSVATALPISLENTNRISSPESPIPFQTSYQKVPSPSSAIPHDNPLHPISLRSSQLTSNLSASSDLMNSLAERITGNGAQNVFLPKAEINVANSNLGGTNFINNNSLTLSRGRTKSSSPQNLSSSPPSKIFKSKGSHGKIEYKEHRRVCHINAEQKRRCNIKNGFDTLRTILPSVSQNANTKISKAAMLQKGAEYIRSLRDERSQQQEEYESLKQQIESLNQTIGVFQSQLPATGAPISCQKTSQMKELFEEHVARRTCENWKYWIFSIVMEPLLTSYTTTVSTNSVDEFCLSVMRWLDQNCCLVTLRRDVLNSLRYLSTTTNILTNPACLPKEALDAVNRKEKKTSE